MSVRKQIVPSLLIRAMFDHIDLLGHEWQNIVLYRARTAGTRRMTRPYVHNRCEVRC